MENFLSLYGIACLIVSMLVLIGSAVIYRRPFLSDCFGLVVIGLGAMLLGGFGDMLSQLCHLRF